MIVHDLNVMCLAIPPDEANPPLVIDPDAVLPGSIPLKRFEMVAGWNTKVVNLLGGMQVKQFAPRDTFDGTKRQHHPIVEKRLRVLASKRPDHALVYDALGIPSMGIAAQAHWFAPA